MAGLETDKFGFIPSAIQYISCVTVDRIIDLSKPHLWIICEMKIILQTLEGFGGRLEWKTHSESITMVLNIIVDNWKLI